MQDDIWPGRRGYYGTVIGANLKRLVGIQSSDNMGMYSFILTQENNN